MQNAYAPVVVFAYNRLDHVRKMLASLEANRAPLEKMDLYIFVDGAREEEEDRRKVTAVRTFLSKFATSSRFAKVEVISQEKHVGLAQSVITGVTSIIDRYGKVIVIEDDLYLAEDFLDYMNDGLNYYQNNSLIWSIGGYVRPFPELESYSNDVFLAYRINSWGWATWKDRWDTIDWSLPDYKKYRYNFMERSKFNRGGHDLAVMLDRQMRGELDSWAIRWGYCQYRSGMMTVYPKVSRVQNLGMDGSGTHCYSSHVYDTELYENGEKCKFVSFESEGLMWKAFQRAMSVPWYKRIKPAILNQIQMLFGGYDQ